MKELSIEEKAKAYDKAISIAKKELNACGSQNCDATRQIFRLFPELKENEDEETKKEIINYLECQSRDEPSRKDTHNKWISYIEKHALSNDDYYFLRDCARVLKTFGWQSYADRLTGLYPALGEGAKAMMSTPIIFDESEDERIRKAILELVKQSSDILNPMNQKSMIAWLEKQGEQNTNEIHPIFRVGDYIKNKKTSDKVLIEQLDIATKAYCYVSYDGGAEIHSDFSFSKQDEWMLIGQNIVEQKNTWSEEDEETLDYIIDYIENNKSHDKIYTKKTEILEGMIDWLKSLKERMV